MKKYITIVLCTTLVSSISCEDRWVWGSGRSSDQTKSGRASDDSLKGEHSIAQPVVAQPNRNNRNKVQQDDGFDGSRNNFNEGPPQRRPQSRYEVEENLNSGLITIQPSRPFQNPNVISLPPRPIPGPIPLPQNQIPGDRFPPSGPGNNFRPNRPGGLPPPPPGALVPAQSRPGGQIAGPPPSVGILTGPVPSWEKGPLNKNGDPTSFQNCKCSHSFNCKAPGIQFGKCDEGKQYCCFNDLNTPGGNRNPLGGGPGPIRGGDSEGFGSEPFILTGPSGPGGRYGAKPSRPFKNGRPLPFGPSGPPNPNQFGGPRDYDDFDFPNRYSQFDRSAKRH